VLILASSSPRRRELLARRAADLRICPVDAAEAHDGAPPRELLARNAAAKADAAAGEFPLDTVIGADTGIVLDGRLIGKPADLTEARGILHELSGREHEVCTAVALRGARRDDFLVATRVRFKILSDDVIDEYLRQVPVLDKAGAYALQDHGEMLVESVEGDRDNVVGLPCAELMKRLGRAHTAWTLFADFAAITTLVVGGGYVILSAMEAKFVRDRKWLSAPEFLDLTATAQTVPGVIACNGAIYLGYRLLGWRGALAALAGTALPPVAVIMLVASGAAYLPRDAAWVRGMFMGVNGAVAGLIAATALRMGRKAASGVVPWCIALAAFAGMVFCKWNPGLLMLGAIPAGIAYTAWTLRRGGKPEGGGQ